MSTIINGTSSAITFPDGTIQNTSATAPVTSVNGLTGAAVIPRGEQLFFTTTNWTAPAGVVRVKIWAVGGSQGGSNLPAGGTAGIVSLGVYAPGGQQNQQPVGVGGTWNKNIGDPSGQTFRLYTGASGCCGPTFYGQGASNGGLVVGYATTVPGTVYSVTAGASFTGTAAGFCWLEW
jgi:hypothetical protein